jgi:hypothetical protein
MPSCHGSFARLFKSANALGGSLATASAISSIFMWRSIAGFIARLSTLVAAGARNPPR